jgi:tetratricopeptide (TPR) repeat protein
MSRSIAFAAAVALAAIAGGCQNANRGASTRTADFDSSADQKPTPRMLQAAARVLAAQGKDAEAFAALRRLQMEYPEFIPAYADIAEYHLRQNRPAEAERILLEGLARAPKDPILINNLGMVAMMTGEYDEALDHFGKAADIAPGESRHRANMGTVLGLMGRYDESYAMFEQVVPPAYAHYNVSVLADGRGDRDRAKQEYDAAVELDPGLAGKGNKAQSKSQE